MCGKAVDVNWVTPGVHQSIGLEVWGGAVYYSALYHAVAHILLSAAALLLVVVLLWPAGRVWTCLCRAHRKRGVAKCWLGRSETFSLPLLSSVAPQQAVPIRSYTANSISVCSWSPKPVVDLLFLKGENKGDHEQRLRWTLSESEGGSGRGITAVGFATTADTWSWVLGRPIYWVDCSQVWKVSSFENWEQESYSAAATCSTSMQRRLKVCC